MNTKPITFTAAVLVSSVTLSFSQQQIQDPAYQIIMERSEEIQETFTQMEASTTVQRNQATELAEEVEELRAKYFNQDLPLAERQLYNAQALEKRALLNRIVQKMGRENAEKFEAVYHDLSEMIEASERMGANNTQLQLAKAKVATYTSRLIEKDTEMRQLLGGVQDMNLDPYTATEYDVSVNMHVAASDAAEALALAFNGEGFTDSLSQLREIVASRRTQLVNMASVAEGNLGIIRKAALHNGTVILINELDRALLAMSTPKDPLALKILQPGSDADLLMSAEVNSIRVNTLGAGSPEKVSIHSLAPLSERFNHN